MKSSPDQAAHQIDWTEVKTRLAKLTTAETESQQTTAAQSQEILAARAAQLAEIPERTPDASEIVKLLTFRLGNDVLAVETSFVREVIRPNDLTVVPGVPTFLVGVTNLRGEVLAIVDIRQFFGSQAQPDRGQWWGIVLGEDRPEFGVVADIVYEVSILRNEQILGVPPSVAEAGRRLLKGVTANSMLVLDGTLLLQDTRLYVDQDD